MFLSAILVGSYANSILYTLEVLAVIQYHLARKHNRDSLPFQAMVYFTLFVDTASTFSTCALVYLVGSLIVSLCISSLIVNPTLQYMITFHGTVTPFILSLTYHDAYSDNYSG
jgi:hypothetical protein